MAKSNIEMTQALAVLDRVAQELGLVVSDTSFGKKVEGPGNKHRMYIQKGRFLGRVDTTVDLGPDDAAYVQLAAPNGSVKCHVKPDLEQLERCLRMLGDASLGTQVPNKPRPFAATKAPSPRRPKAVATPVPAEALKEVAIDPAKKLLADRVALIHARARAARVRMILENPEKYGELSEAEAEALVDGRGTQSADDALDVVEAVRNSSIAVTTEVIDEAGLEVTS